MVGDEDQSIYMFRAAYPQALLNFDKTYSNSKILLMETNYRSTPQILNSANMFIKQNKSRKDKNIIPFNKNGEKIQKKIFDTIEEQYEYVLKQSKHNKEKMAILYRNNDSAIPIINLFNKNKIKYTIREMDSSFFSNTIVQDIKYFILFYFYQNDLEIFKKIYYKINCGISKKMINKLQMKMELNPKKTLLENLINVDETAFWQIRKLEDLRLEMILWDKKNSYDIIKSILKTLEYEVYLKNKKNDNSSNTQKINVLYSLAKQTPKIADFLKKLDELEEIIKNGAKDDKNLILSTIHGSKGLEYDRVLLIDTIDGIIPSVEKPKNEKSKSINEYEEEVRLFYVGMTRAKSKLEILSYKTAYGEEIGLSSFIDEVFV